MDKLVQEQSTEEIKERRERIAVSQEELATEAGVSYRTILRFENGNKIRDEKLSKVVSALQKLEKSRESHKRQSLWWLSHKRAVTETEITKALRTEAGREAGTRPGPRPTPETGEMT